MKRRGFFLKAIGVGAAATAAAAMPKPEPSIFDGSFRPVCGGCGYDLLIRSKPDRWWRAGNEPGLVRCHKEGCPQYGILIEVKPSRLEARQIPTARI